MNSGAEPTGTLDVALSHAQRLLDSKPELAAEQAAEILKLVPNHPLAMLLLGVARRLTGNVPAALRLLGPVAASQPRWARAHYELGLAQADAAQPGAAIVSLRRAVFLRPGMPDAWRTLGDLLTFSGDARGADAAYAEHIKASTQDPHLLIPASALVEGRNIAENDEMGNLPHFTTFDFALGTGLANWHVEAYIENAFGKQGELSRNNECATPNCYINYRVYPVKPMNFGVKFGQKF